MDRFTSSAFNNRPWGKHCCKEFFVILKWHSVCWKPPFIERSQPQGWVSSFSPQASPASPEPSLPLWWRSWLCWGSGYSLTLLCSWGIWHAMQPNGSLALSLLSSGLLSLSVSIMLAPWPKIVLSAGWTQASSDSMAAFIGHFHWGGSCQLCQRKQQSETKCVRCHHSFECAISDDLILCWKF